MLTSKILSGLLILGGLNAALPSLCAQDDKKEYRPIRSIDMFVGSSQKAFKSSKVKYYGLWNRIEHDCRGEMPMDWNNAYRDVPKFAQSNFLDLVRGGVQISNQVIYPTEQQFFQNTLSSDLGRYYSCMSGLSYRDEVFVMQNVDYFNLAIENLLYLEEELAYGHYVHGKEYRCRILQSAEQMDSVLNDPTQIGCVFTLQGGHSLGNYLYIDQGLTASSEYQNLVLNNIDKLKGGVPLRSNSNDMLRVPVFAVSFGNFYQDGMVGKTAQFAIEEQTLFGKQTSVGDKITPLGQAVIQRLLSRETGRRILVDVGGMSLEGREWYYSYVKDRRYSKDTIPVLALNVGISGLSTKESDYKDKDERLKGQGSLLNNRQHNLSRQDLTEIINSKGLIGLSLDRDKLMGRGFQLRYNATIEHTAERRAVAIDAIVGNICKMVQVTNMVEAWDVISLSSQFDTHHARPLDVFRSSEDFYQLYRELLVFFQKPRDIEGLYTANEIKKFMYGYSAEEIVDRIMFRNAYEFLRRQLPKKAKP